MSVKLLLACVLLWSAVAVSACESIMGPREAAEGGLVKRVELGVFYGGQVQQREQVPLVIDQAAQQFGFRVVFSAPLSDTARIAWEVDKPSASGRVTVLGEVTARAGMGQLDQSLEFSQSDSLGIYNVRVFVRKRLVMDRAVQVVEADADRD